MMTGPVTLWWRDDDAGEDDDRTLAFLAKVQRWQLPLTLAVIPAQLSDSVAEAILQCPWITVVQHGWNHDDHSADDQKKIELGGQIDRHELAYQLNTGQSLLRSRFQNQYWPMMVPPWNRIEKDVSKLIEQSGHWATLSCFAKTIEPIMPGAQIDTHLDLVDWRGSGRQKSPAQIEEEWTRLTSSVVNDDEIRAIGLLSHHRVRNDEDVDQLGDFLGRCAGDPDVRFCGVRELTCVVSREMSAKETGDE